MALRDHFIFATMVIKMSSSSAALSTENVTASTPHSKQQNFSIDALLNLENTEKTSSSHLGSISSTKLTADPGSSALSTNKTPFELPLAFNSLPFHAGYMGLPPATFMEPIYRTESAGTRDSPTSTKPHTPLFPAAYPWTALAALHNSTVQAAAAAFSRSYLPAMMPHGHIDSISDWSEYFSFNKLL